MSTVGERALALCPRASGTVALYRSQWAGSDRRIREVLDTEPPSAEPLFACEWTFAGSDHPSILLRSLDYLGLEVVYLLGPRGVAVLFPLWLGIPTAAGSGTAPASGILLPVRSLAEFRRLRGQVRRIKELCGAAIERGILTEREAQACLLSVTISRYWE